VSEVHEADDQMSPRLPVHCIQSWEEAPAIVGGRR
jgi:hypothetical protein